MEQLLQTTSSIKNIISKEMIWICFTSHTPRLDLVAKQRKEKFFLAISRTKRHLNTAEIILEKAGPGRGISK